jgi:hypothetical protein
MRGARETGIWNHRTALDGGSCSSEKKNFGAGSLGRLDTLKMRF